MPEITTTLKNLLSLGNRDGVVAKAATIDNADTFNTGLSSIEHVDITNGTSGVTIGYTKSGGTITFALSGQLTNPSILVVGFK